MTVILLLSVIASGDEALFSGCEEEVVPTSGHSRSV